MDRVRELVRDETLADGFARSPSMRPATSSSSTSFASPERTTTSRCGPVRRPCWTSAHRHRHHDGEIRHHRPRPRLPGAEGNRQRSRTRRRNGHDPDRGAVLELDKEGVYDGAIAVVGNAPTAALALATASRTALGRPSSSPRPSASSRLLRAGNGSARSPPNMASRPSRTSAAAAGAGWPPG